MDKDRKAKIDAGKKLLNQYRKKKAAISKKIDEKGTVQEGAKKSESDCQESILSKNCIDGSKGGERKDNENLIEAIDSSSFDSKNDSCSQQTQNFRVQEYPHSNEPAFDPVSVPTKSPDLTKLYENTKADSDSKNVKSAGMCVSSTVQEKWDFNKSEEIFEENVNMLKQVFQVEGIPYQQLNISASNVNSKKMDVEKSEFDENNKNKENFSHQMEFGEIAFDDKAELLIIALRKIQDYQSAIVKRDKIISALTERMCLILEESKGKYVPGSESYFAEVTTLKSEFKTTVQELQNALSHRNVEIKQLREEIKDFKTKYGDIDVQQVGEQEMRQRGHLYESSSHFDLSAWQVDARDTAITNSRLLNVLSDLVKMNFETEKDIQVRLQEFGFPPINSELHDDDTCQSAGSREDCTGFPLGENSNLELTEDGPDLTPRALNILSSTVTYDAEVEGEDVVIGASKRLRFAVNHILNLLACILGREIEEKISDISDVTSDTNENKKDLNKNLSMAENNIQRLTTEKHQIETENQKLHKEKEQLYHEVELMKSKIRYLQEEKDIVLDEKRGLQKQCEILATANLGEIEKKILDENAKLTSENTNIKIQCNKERQDMSSKFQILELKVEELFSDREKLIEKHEMAVQELELQLDSVSNQLFATKKFLEEQTSEREQEREEYLKGKEELKAMKMEKEKLKLSLLSCTVEVETAERQLKETTEDLRLALKKNKDYEEELKFSSGKINDLKDIITEYESNLIKKNEKEDYLKEQLQNVTASFTELEIHCDQLKELLKQYEVKDMDLVSVKQLNVLKEQLESKSQEITLLSQSDSLLQELRGQVFTFF